ncbi:MAG: 3-isopropylmalate dehydrogenase [Deltaproteobacteria bacterium]|nr:3-isopropylmalate dehydrogenase [Deltaproteobacteria bacterium]
MDSSRKHIVLLPGDGIGPEIVQAGWQVLQWLDARFEFGLSSETHAVGGAAIAETGSPLPASTLEACKGATAVLLGAVGDPRYDNPQAEVRPEQGLLTLRQELQLFANIRPVKTSEGSLRWSPLKPERVEGVDLLIVRELTGGIYFGDRARGSDESGRWAQDTMRYSEGEIQRVARLAFSLARSRRKKLTSVDKANVLHSSRLWREVVTEVHKDFADITLEHQLVDSCAMRLIDDAQSMDVIVTSNMFGDILSDESAAIAGSLGLLPSASWGSAAPALYEPIHGSAPALAGKGLANPMATISSVSLMLRHSLNAAEQASALDRAVALTLDAGVCTPDLGGHSSTQEVVQVVLQQLEEVCA